MMKLTNVSKVKWGSYYRKGGNLDRMEVDVVI